MRRRKRHRRVYRPAHGNRHQRRRVAHCAYGDVDRGRDGGDAVRHGGGERVCAIEVRVALIAQGGQGRVELSRGAAEGHAPGPEHPGRHRGTAGQGRRERAVADAQPYRERPTILVAHRHCARRGDLPDPIIGVVSHVDVTRCVHRHSIHLIELRRRAGTVQVPCDAATRRRRYQTCRGDRPDPMIVAITHSDVARRVHRHATQIVELRRRARAVRETPGTARQRRHHAPRGNLPDPIIRLVSHVNVTRRVHRHANRIVELRAPARAVRGTRGAAARQCRHRARRGDLPDPIINHVSHVNVTIPVHRNVSRSSELRRRARAVRETRGDGARQCRHHARRGDLPDLMIARVSHVNVPRRVDRDATRFFELRQQAIGVTNGAARQRRHHARRGDLPDLIIARVSHVNVTIPVHRHAVRSAELRRRAGAVRETSGAARQRRHLLGQVKQGVLRPREAARHGEDRGLVYIGHRHGHRLGGAGAARIGGAHDDDVGVVAVGVCGGFIVGRGGEGEHAAAAVDAELRGISPAVEAVGDRLAIGIGRHHGLRDGLVLGQADGGAGGKNRHIVHCRHRHPHLNRAGRGLLLVVPRPDGEGVQRPVGVRRRGPHQRLGGAQQRRARRHRQPALGQRPRAHRFHPETHHGAVRVRFICRCGQRRIADRECRILGRARQRAHCGQGGGQQSNGP